MISHAIKLLDDKQISYDSPLNYNNDIANYSFQIVPNGNMYIELYLLANVEYTFSFIGGTRYLKAIFYMNNEIVSEFTNSQSNDNNYSFVFISDSMSKYILKLSQTAQNDGGIKMNITPSPVEEDTDKEINYRYSNMSEFNGNYNQAGSVHQIDETQSLIPIDFSNSNTQEDVEIISDYSNLYLCFDNNVETSCELGYISSGNDIEFIVHFFNEQKRIRYFSFIFDYNGQLYEITSCYISMFVSNNGTSWEYTNKIKLFTNNMYDGTYFFDKSTNNFSGYYLPCRNTVYVDFNNDKPFLYYKIVFSAKKENMGNPTTKLIIKDIKAYDSDIMLYPFLHFPLSSDYISEDRKILPEYNNLVLQTIEDKNCAYFNGVNSHIAFSQLIFSQNTSKFGLSFWFYIDENRKNNATIISKNGFEISYFIENNVLNIKCILNIGGIKANGQYSFPIEDIQNAWNNLVATFNGNTFKVFLNKKDIIKIYGVGNVVIDVSEKFYFGRTNNGQKYFNGWMRNIMFYNCNLDENQITKIYISQK